MDTAFNKILHGSIRKYFFSPTAGKHLYGVTVGNGDYHDKRMPSGIDMLQGSSSVQMLGIVHSCGK